MAAIKGIKTDIFKNTIIYFLKEHHSQICEKLNKKISVKDKIEKKTDKKDNNKN